jgi:predicted nucleotidyltransferase
MIPLIKNNIQSIQELCKRHHVSSLYLFGSAVNEQAFTQQSDIDFLYEIDTDNFKNWDTGDYDYIDNLADLEIKLNNLLSRKIDLVPYKNINNKYFKEIVDRSRQLVYAA